LMNDLDENTNGYHELASENANELNDRGEWQENTNYELNDLIKYNENKYYCREAHESSEVFEVYYWIHTEKEVGERWDGIL